MMKIIGIKSDKGYYIADANKSSYTYLSEYFINGEKPHKTFKSDWFFTPSEPKLLEKLVVRPNINHRYELRDKSLSDKFQEVYKKEDVYLHTDEDGDKVFTIEFQSISSLYNLVSDKQEPILEKVEFEYVTIESIEELREPVAFSYKRYGQFGKEILSLKENGVKHDILDEILTPSILIHTKPSKLSAQETFDIIRAYIKDNIDPKVAEITSDYDFCLTVQKRVPKAKPYVYEVDVNASYFGGRKKKPKYETRTKHIDKFTVFECAPKAYQSYSVVQPFVGDSQEDLKEYIDKYLEHIISVINEPVKQCECCEGIGIVKNKCVS